MALDIAGRRWPTALRTRGTLHERFDPRRNSLTMMRLGLALIVAFVHALAVGFGHQPWIGSAQLGELAVDGFFVISGFLVTRSLLRLDSMPRYVWHRFLRIMPGFWACLAVTAAVVAPLVAVLSGRAATLVFTAPENSAVDYVVANAALMIRQWDIAGLPAGVPEPGVMDGSLWTLFYEAVCYAVVGGLGVLGLLRRRRAAVVGMVAALWAATVANAAGLAVVSQERMLRFLLLFLLGALGLLYARRIPVSGWLALGSLGTLLAGLYLLPDYRALAAPAFAYLFLWAAVALPLRQEPAWDLSYGIYVYHWPVHQLLVLLGLAAWGEPLFVAVSVPLAALAAVVSWRLVEGPALGLKDAAWVDRVRLPRALGALGPRAVPEPPAAAPTLSQE